MKKSIAFLLLLFLTSCVEETEMTENEIIEMEIQAENERLIEYELSDRFKDDSPTPDESGSAQ
jgi:hypothetical protein